MTTRSPACTAANDTGVGPRRTFENASTTNRCYSIRLGDEAYGVPLYAAIAESSGPRSQLAAAPTSRSTRAFLCVVFTASINSRLLLGNAAVQENNSLRP